MSAIDVAPVRQGPLTPGVGRIWGWAITSYFGGRIDPLTGRPGQHGGMDLAYGGCFRSEIVAPVSGSVSQGWDNSGGGFWTSLFADNGDYWGFGHTDSFAWAGGGNHRVEAGQAVAYVGSTGASTGAHLHIAFRPRGATSYQDPFDVLEAAATSSGRGGRGGRRGLRQPLRSGDDSDMADIGEIQTELSNQDARTKAFIDAAIAAKDARDRAFMTALVAKATRAIGGDDALDRLKAELRAGRKG